MKKVFAMLWALVFLCGCNVMVEDKNSDIKPPDEPVDIRVTDEYSIKPALYFLDDKAGTLAANIQTIPVRHAEGEIDVILKRLLSSLPSEELKSPGFGMSYSFSEITENIINVYLNGGEAVTDKNRFTACQAITNTLCEYFSVDYVCVFIDGVSMGMPFSFSMDPISTLFETNYLNTEDADEIEAVLYFVDETQKYIMPEVHTIRSDINLVQNILTELSQGARSKSYLLPSISNNFTSVKLSTAKPGAINIALDSYPGISVDSNTSGTDLTDAALAYTLTSILKAREINIYEGDKYLKTLDRAKYRELLGSTARLFFPKKDMSAMVPVTHMVPYATASDKKGLLKQLIKGPQNIDPKYAWPVFPEGISTKDVLSVNVSGNMVIVNMSSNFAKKAKALAYDKEMLLIYSIVNTLTDSNIKRVQIIIEGKVQEYLAGGIYIKYPLVPNPGLITD